MTQLRLGAAAAALVLLGAPAQAVPTFDNFGTLFAATFGGSGIPNDAVAITDVTVGGDTILLGLTAHQRFVGPNLANDGAGIFTAPAGFATPPASSLGGALWNFGYYIEAGSALALSDYQIDIFYDFDPGADTPLSEMGRIDVTAFLVANNAGGLKGLVLEGSENLAFGFLSAGIPGLVIPPLFPSFDPFAEGEYSFAITVATETEIDRVGIKVNVVGETSTVVPVPAALPLLGLGLAALAFAGRRRAA